jgi:hypothetical protein
MMMLNGFNPLWRIVEKVYLFFAPPPVLSSVKYRYTVRLSQVVEGGDGYLPLATIYTSGCCIRFIHGRCLFSDVFLWMGLLIRHVLWIG